MAAALVQFKMITTNALTNGSTFSLPNPVTAGNTIIVISFWYNGCPPTITDTQLNTYTRTNPASGYFVSTAVLASSGTPTFTVTAGCGSNSNGFVIAEVSGLQANPFDQFSFVNATASPATGTAITPTSNGQYIMAMFGHAVLNLGTPTVNSPFTLEAIESPNDSAVFADYVQPTAGSIAATLNGSNISGSYPLACTLWSFKAVTAVTTTKTETGVARITAKTTKTITGKGRVTTSTSQTETGKSRIQVTTTKTETGLSRIAYITSQNLETNGDPTDLSTYTTGSVTPSANKLELLYVYSIASTAPNTPTVTGCGLTWVEVGHIDDGSSTHRKLTLFRAMGASPTTGALSISFGGQTQTGCAWSLSEYTGMNTSGTNGSGSIVQSATNFDSVGSGALSVTLASFSNAKNATVAAFGFPLNSDGTVGGSFVQIGAIHQQNPNLALFSEFYVANSTTPSVTVGGSVPMTGLAVEIQVAGSTTTQNETGVARITATTTKIETGVGRIKVTALKTITGVSRVTASTLKTEIGVARITAVATKIVTGVARLTRTTTGTETGLSRITAKTTRTITGVANITVTGTTSRTETGTARITASTIRTETGVARIQITTNKTETGVARIQIKTTRAITGVARIQISSVKTETGVSRVTKSASRTITGVSNIVASSSPGTRTKIITGVASIIGAKHKGNQWAVLTTKVSPLSTLRTYPESKTVL